MDTQTLHIGSENGPYYESMVWHIHVTFVDSSFMSVNYLRYQAFCGHPSWLDTYVWVRCDELFS